MKLLRTLRRVLLKTKTLSSTCLFSKAISNKVRVRILIVPNLADVNWWIMELKIKYSITNLIMAPKGTKEN